ncbi:MAG: hypothetical protein VKP70_09920 [Cyanobacteriota bacterium]|nr:hypothetical protein [Cyanobacteriota bacterium]
MSSFQANQLSSGQMGHEDLVNLEFLQNFDSSADPVEAYFECITQCSLDDGECVTVCTSILREQA